MMESGGKSGKQNRNGGWSRKVESENENGKRKAKQIRPELPDSLMQHAADLRDQEKWC